MSNVLYSAVVLDDNSRKRLIDVFESLLNDEWTPIAHHMTIIFGSELPDDLKEYNGKTVKLRITDYAMDDKVMAVKVIGFPSTNDIPHITVAINKNNGGKPVMSNNLRDWKPIKELNKNMDVKLYGVVQEIIKS